jgi:hypothetical protein
MVSSSKCIAIAEGSAEQHLSGGVVGGADTAADTVMVQGSVRKEDSALGYVLRLATHRSLSTWSGLQY